MLELKEIETGILALPKNKYSDLRKWFLDLDYKTGTTKLSKILNQENWTFSWKKR